MFIGSFWTSHGPSEHGSTNSSPIPALCISWHFINMYSSQLRGWLMTSREGSVQAWRRRLIKSPIILSLEWPLSHPWMMDAHLIAVARPWKRRDSDRYTEVCAHCVFKTRVLSQGLYARPVENHYFSITSNNAKQKRTIGWEGWEIFMYVGLIPKGRHIVNPLDKGSLSTTWCDVRQHVQGHTGVRWAQGWCCQKSTMPGSGSAELPLWLPGSNESRV